MRFLTNQKEHTYSLATSRTILPEKFLGIFWKARIRRNRLLSLFKKKLQSGSWQKTEKKVFSPFRSEATARQNTGAPSKQEVFIPHPKLIPLLFLFVISTKINLLATILQKKIFLLF